MDGELGTATADRIGPLLQSAFAQALEDITADGLEQVAKRRE